MSKYARGMALEAAPCPKLENPVAVFGRQHLPDASNELLPKQLSSSNGEWPAFFNSTETDVEILAKTLTSPEFEKKLVEEGAVLIQTNLRTYQEFSDLIDEAGWQTRGADDFARSMGARSMTSTCVTSSVRTASDDHRLYTIEPHHEYHTCAFPNNILLFCETCPSSGGEWPVGNGREILKQLKPEVVEKFERLGARYSLFYPSVNSPEGSRYNTWEKNIMPTKEETESYLEDRGYTWEWGENNSLRYWQNFPAIRSHPKTGERVWFNQIHAHHKSFYECHPAFANSFEATASKNQWPVDCLYGDGSPIEKETLDHIREIVWKNCIGIHPKPGHLLICDNWLALHGRLSFPEGERKVYAATTFYDEDDEE